MGNHCCTPEKLRFSKFKTRNITILLAGLDNSGKSTTVRTLAGEPSENLLPTIGFSRIVMYYRKFKIIIYDVGGGKQIRDIWNNYLSDVHGIIYVVDASDVQRLNETAEIFKNLLSNEKISGKPILLLANKQDKDNSLDEEEIVEHMNIEAVVNEFRCMTRIETCCAIYTPNVKIDPTLKSGYRWLIDTIIDDYETLNYRVEGDREKEAAWVKKDKELWKKRKTEVQSNETLQTDVEECDKNHSDIGWEKIINGSINNRKMVNGNLSKSKNDKGNSMNSNGFSGEMNGLSNNHNPERKLKKINKTAPMNGQPSTFDKVQINVIESFLIKNEDKTNRSRRPSTAPPQISTNLNAFGLNQPLQVINLEPENLVESSPKNADPS